MMEVSMSYLSVLLVLLIASQSTFASSNVSFIKCFDDQKDVRFEPALTFYLKDGDLRTPLLIQGQLDDGETYLITPENYQLIEKDDQITITAKAETFQIGSDKVEGPFSLRLHMTWGRSQIVPGDYALLSIFREVPGLVHWIPLDQKLSCLFYGPVK
jgi:hypothetical protein